MRYEKNPYMMAIGKEEKTTFWNDFSLADRFGKYAVKETFDRAFAEWKKNYIYLTELVLTLNHKIWFYYERGNKALAATYHELWETADAYACENLTGDEMSYFITETD